MDEYMTSYAGIVSLFVLKKSYAWILKRGYFLNDTHGKIHLKEYYETTI